MQLTKESIIQASLEILQQYGLADMTMRRLAKQLEVAPGAMYWHFKNKQALIDATAREILRPFFHALSPDNTLEQRCRYLRDIMLNCRDGAELLSAALSDPELRDDVIKVLRSAPDVETSSINIDTVVGACLHFVLGSALLTQANQQQSASFGEPPEPNSALIAKANDEFHEQLNVLLAGVTTALP